MDDTDVGFTFGTDAADIEVCGDGQYGVVIETCKFKQPNTRVKQLGKADLLLGQTD